MPGCCLAALVLFLGPRVFLVFVYLFTDWFRAFQPWGLGLLGFLFLPWTSLAWMYTYFQHGGQIEGAYVLLFFVSLLLDVGPFSARRAKE